jgi:putative cell wall-binding protein
MITTTAVVVAAVAVTPNAANAAVPVDLPVAYETAPAGTVTTQAVSMTGLDGSGTHQVSVGGADGLSSPVWRPDAAALAVATSSGAASTGTVIAAPDGSSTQRVGPADAWPLSFSPDGAQVALAEPMTNRGSKLLIVDVRGGAVRTVWDGSKGYFVPDLGYRPSWSPDGSQLAFNAVPAGCMELDCGELTWIVSADGSGLHQVPNGGNLGHVQFSPDGHWLLGDGLYREHPDGTGGGYLAGSGMQALDPIWSPDGTMIAYLCGSGSDRICVINADSGNARTLDTPPTNSRDEDLSWLPDGGGLVFDRVTTDLVTRTSTYAVHTIRADGSGLRQVASPGYRPMVPALVTRRAGATRVDTAVSLSRSAFAAAPAVVIARDDLYADALAAGPLAAKVGGPLLLSPPSGLPTTVSTEIRRLGATTAYVIGDTTALAAIIDTQLEAAGVTTVHRIGGATRYDTAALVAEHIGGSNIYIARGDTWPDAASVSALAAYQQRPILLTAGTALPGGTTAAIAALQATHATIIGGTAAVSDSVQNELATDGLAVDRLAGADRYATSAAVASAGTAAGLTGSTWLTDGQNWPDAIAAGPSAARLHGDVILVDPHRLANSPATSAWITSHPTASVTAVGGPDVVSPGDAITALKS